MEGSENNPVMFELMSELPWRAEKITKEDWIREYCYARYGVHDATIEKHGPFLRKASTTVRRATSNRVPTRASSAPVHR